MSNMTSEAHLESPYHPTDYLYCFHRNGSVFLLWDASLIGFIYDNRDNGRLKGPGLGWSSQEASLIRMVYNVSAYVMSILDSMIADKLLGQKKLF
jgi:POT family proton-dependent oligopeptide transporter